jgi:predicted transposase YbfD/YdcC
MCTFNILLSQKDIAMEDKHAGFFDFFKEVPDHRIERRKLHAVEEILLVTFCGVAAGCDAWEDIEDFGKIKIDYLRQYFPYQHGVPSDDTLRRFFRALDPEIFEACFIKWVKSFQLDLAQKVVAVDGKTARRSFDGDGRPMHLVSAWASELGVVLGQLKTEEKSNEITAIPELLNVLDLAGAIVTIDAMGCQSKIVETIIEKKADYVISLKGNQGTLSSDVQLLFTHKPQQIVFQTETEHDKGHGRIETRRCTVTEGISWLQEQHPHWKGLRSVIEIESTREIKGEITREKRYYISSLAAETSPILSAVRQHWGVENRLHWVLDVSFGDDQSRIRKGNAPRNMAIIKKTVLNLLNIIKKTSPRTSLKRMRKMAGWDNAFLERVLTAEF